MLDHIVEGPLGRERQRDGGHGWSPFALLMSQAIGRCNRTASDSSSASYRRQSCGSGCTAEDSARGRFQAVAADWSATTGSRKRDAMATASTTTQPIISPAISP